MLGESLIPTCSTSVEVSRFRPLRPEKQFFARLVAHTTGRGCAGLPAPQEFVRNPKTPARTFAVSGTSLAFGFVLAGKTAVSGTVQVASSLDSLKDFAKRHRFAKMQSKRGSGTPNQGCQKIAGGQHTTLTGNRLPRSIEIESDSKR